MYCTYVQYSNHLSAGKKNYMLSGYKTEMNMINSTMCYISMDCVSILRFVMVVNRLSYIRKGRNNLKKLIEFILF